MVETHLWNIKKNSLIIFVCSKLFYWVFNKKKKTIYLKLEKAPCAFTRIIVNIILQFHSRAYNLLKLINAEGYDNDDIPMTCLNSCAYPSTLSSAQWIDSMPYSSRSHCLYHGRYVDGGHLFVSAAMSTIPIATFTVYGVWPSWRLAILAGICQKSQCLFLSLV